MCVCVCVRERERERERLQTQPVTQESGADFQSVVFVTNTSGNGRRKT